MDSVLLQLCYDGWWETLAEGHIEYVNDNNIIFLIQKYCTFDKFLARVYDVLRINRNKYNITMKTTLRSSNTEYRSYISRHSGSVHYQCCFISFPMIYDPMGDFENYLSHQHDSSI